jgi:hypothetical protein
MPSLAKKYAADLTANVLTSLIPGGVAADDAGTYLINFCNRGTSDVTVRLAVTDGNAADPADYLEFDATIEAKGVLARHPVPLGQGFLVFAHASAAGVSVNVIGRKEG